MNKQQVQQNIWAMTNTPVIEMTTKNICRTHSTFSPNDSTTDNNCVESPGSRFGCSTLVPKEFESPSPIRTKTGESLIPLNENEEVLPNQSPVLKPKTSVGKRVSKLPPISNSKSSLIPNPKLELEKECMLKYGRELSDLIIGSSIALHSFISMFNEWKLVRLELISQFQYLEKNLKEASGKFTSYKDMLSFAKTGATVAAAVHLPYISAAGRVVSIFTSLFSIFLNTSDKNTAEAEGGNELNIAARRDTSASHDLYMHGLQCGLNFEDTAKFIENFHSNVINPVIFEEDSPEIATFIRGVLAYEPRHRIFYKKLHKCFQELLQNRSSEFGESFCEPFLLYSPEAIDVLEFLNWRFRHEDFNGESVRYELQQIENLIQAKDTTIKELTVRIQTCVGILKDELKFLERCVEDFDLFVKSTQF